MPNRLAWTIGIFGAFLKTTADHINHVAAASLIFIVAVRGDYSLPLTFNVIVEQNLSLI